MPLTPHEYQAALLAEYQQTLVVDHAAASPAGLDPTIAALARRLAAAPVGVAPDAAFVATLEARLGLRAAPPSAVVSPWRMLWPGKVPPAGREPLQANSDAQFPQLVPQLVPASGSQMGDPVADLMVVPMPPVASRTSARWHAFWAGGALAAALILFALVALAMALLLRDSSQTAPAIATQLPTTPATSAMLTMISISQTPLGEQRRTTTTWYAAPGRWRSEEKGDTSPEGDYIAMNDGVVLWSYSPSSNQARQYDANLAPLLPQFGEGVSSLEALVQRLAPCYAVTLSGTDNIAGRATYLLRLGPTHCPSGVESAQWNGRQEVWVDQATMFVLQARKYSATDAQQPSYTSTVTSIAYDVPIDPERFTFVPPPGARIADVRRPSPAQFLDELARLAPTIAFLVFAPRDIAGMAPASLPEWTPTRPMLTIAYAPTAIGPGAHQVTIKQQRAASPGLMAPYEQEGVQIGRLPGWYGLARDGSNVPQLSFFRDGTFVQIQAWGFSKEELIAFADTFVPIPGAHPPLPDPQP